MAPEPFLQTFDSTLPWADASPTAAVNLIKITKMKKKQTEFKKLKTDNDCNLLKIDLQSVLQLTKEMCPISIKLSEKESIEQEAKSPPRCFKTMIQFSPS